MIYPTQFMGARLVFSVRVPVLPVQRLPFPDGPGMGEIFVRQGGNLAQYSRFHYKIYRTICFLVGVPF